MVKHVILWQINTAITEKEKEKIKADMKRELENLVGKVPGLIEMKIHINPLTTANADVMLESLMESEDALKGYSVHPAHVEVADRYVRPFMINRICMDCEV